MNSSRTRLVEKLLVILAVALWAGGASASESRADALLYNPAFFDLVDIFTFPQLAGDYNSVTFYLPATDTKNNLYGGLVYKGFGIFVHRPQFDLFQQYRLVGVKGNEQFTNLFSPAPANRATRVSPVIFDLLWGNGEFGVGVKFYGNAKNHETVSNEGVSDNPGANRMLGGALTAGFSPHEGLDAALSARVENEKDLYTATDVGVKARYIADPKASTSLVAAGQIGFGIYAPKHGDNIWAIGVPLRAGLRLLPVEDRLTISALGGLDLQFGDPGADDKQFSIIVPTAEVAAELKILKWLVLRSAIKGGYAILVAGGHGSHDTTDMVSFNSGLGFEFKNFVLDALIKYSLWQNGPYFLGGEKGLFGSVSLSYNF